MTTHIKATYSSLRRRAQHRREHAEFEQVLRMAPANLRNELIIIASR